jgi:hypothetical protein
MCPCQAARCFGNFADTQIWQISSARSSKQQFARIDVANLARRWKALHSVPDMAPDIEYARSGSNSPRSRPLSEVEHPACEAIVEFEVFAMTAEIIDLSGEKQKRAARQASFEKASSQINLLFHDPDGVAWANVTIAGHRETLAVESEEMSHYLKQQASEACEELFGQAKAMLADCIERLKAQALYELVPTRGRDRVVPPRGKPATGQVPLRSPEQVYYHPRLAISRRLLMCQTTSGFIMETTPDVQHVRTLRRSCVGMAGEVEAHR